VKAMGKTLANGSFSFREQIIHECSWAVPKAVLANAVNGDQHRPFAAAVAFISAVTRPIKGCRPHDEAAIWFPYLSGNITVVAT
jgi:hypothetical protein